MAAADISIIVTALGVFIGALGALFAVGAIAAGLILFRQSREHRNQIEDFVGRYGKILDGMKEQAQAQIEGTIAELRLQGEAAEGETKERIEAYIARLEQRRGDAAISLPPLGASGAGFSAAVGEAMMRGGAPHYKCPACGYEWLDHAPNPNTMIQCPGCTLWQVKSQAQARRPAG